MKYVYRADIILLLLLGLKSEPESKIEIVVEFWFKPSSFSLEKSLFRGSIYLGQTNR